MRIISRQTGRVLQYVNLDELTPLDGLYVPDITPLVMERYNFVTPPNTQIPWREVFDQGFKFEMGKLKTHSGEQQIQDLIFYNNGMVVTGYTTQEAEEVLDDFLEWGAETFGLRVDMIPQNSRVYLSEIVIQFDESIDKAIQGFERVAEAYRNMLNVAYSNQFPNVHIKSFGVDYDQVLLAPPFNMLASFHIEKRANHSLADSIYYCQAPLRTEDHVRLLDMFESLWVR